MADEAAELAHIAIDLRALAGELTASLDDVAGAAGEYTWIGPAADRFRSELRGRRAEVDDVAAGLIGVAAGLDAHVEAMALEAAARDQRIRLLGAR